MDVLSFCLCIVVISLNKNFTPSFFLIFWCIILYSRIFLVKGKPIPRGKYIRAENSILQIWKMTYGFFSHRRKESQIKKFVSD